MQIQLSFDGQKGAFYYAEDGKRLATSTFSMAGNKMIIDHTEVDESLKGKSVGIAIIKTAVEYAREKGIKIIPLCPFAAAMFRKHPEFSDVKN